MMDPVRRLTQAKVLILGFSGVAAEVGELPAVMATPGPVTSQSAWR